MENLPEELKMEILAKLSAGSLMRMSGVSKPWRHLIRNPYVIEKQLKNSVRNNKDRSIIFLNCWSKSSEKKEDCWSSEKGTRKELVLSSNNPCSPLITHQRQESECSEVVGSCNGIICSVVNETRVYLYNPMTGEEKKLPPNISSYSTILGFGFDECDNDYKVVLINERVEVYRLSTDKWRVIDLDLKSKYKFSNCRRGVCLNGFYHWPTMGNKIVTFDLHDETFGEMDYPVRGRGNLGLGVLDESLAVCLSDFSTREIQIWVMSEHGENESWTKKFSVRSPENPMYLMAFWVHNMEIVLFGYYIDPANSKYAVCHTKEGRTTLFELPSRSWSITGAVFEPSLVSLRSQQH